MTLKEFWKKFNEGENWNYFVDLYCRWQDEKEYEDIKDYATALTKHYGIDFISGTRQFHFKVKGSDGWVGELFLKNGNTLSIKVIEKGE